jgi:hypothetical protein
MNSFYLLDLECLHSKTVTADTAVGLGAILTQKNSFDTFYAILYASHQLKDHKNYSPFLLKSAAAVWGMDVLNEYLKGKKLFYIPITNLWKKWVTCTLKQ